MPPWGPASGDATKPGVTAEEMASKPKIKSN